MMAALLIGAASGSVPKAFDLAEEIRREAEKRYPDPVQENQPVTLDEMRKAAKPAAPALDSGFAIG